MQKTVRYFSITLLILFGLLTLFLSTSIILDLFGIREKEGNYVSIVVWANFFTSVLYLFAAYGFIKRKSITTVALAASTVILIGAAIAFTIHINSGGIYETKTIGALFFRIGLTALLAVASYYSISRDNAK